MRQTPSSLSTEARIYAKNLGYEIDRREKLGATALDPSGKATVWRDAQAALRLAFMNEGSAPRRVKLLGGAASRLERIAPSDRSFRIAMFAARNGKRSIFDLRTFVHGSHPLEGLEHETGVTGLCAFFQTRRTLQESFINIPSVYVSNHAIGRIRERAKEWCAPEIGLSALHIATVAADLARYDTRLGDASSLSCAIEGGIFTGSMRRSPAKDHPAPLWDVRTLLDEKFSLDPATVQQASAVAELAIRILTGGENWMTLALQSRGDNTIDFVEQREDHVTATLRARSGLKH